MAIAKNEHEYRYAETIGGVVQPFTAWMPLTDSNSTLANGNIVLSVGDKNIAIGNLQVRVAANTGLNRPDGAILTNPVAFTKAALPAPPAPTNGVVDDTANTFTFTPAAS